jgi:hypothetical protein
VIGGNISTTAVESAAIGINATPFDSLTFKAVSNDHNQYEISVVFMPQTAYCAATSKCGLCARHRMAPKICMKRDALRGVETWLPVTFA